MVGVLDRKLWRELKSTGYSRSDIVAFATEMLSLVSSDIRGDIASDRDAE